jgi:hypothetical protein
MRIRFTSFLFHRFLVILLIAPGCALYSVPYRDSETSTEEYDYDRNTGQQYAIGYSVAAGVNHYAHLQLWNPIDSGRMVIIKHIRVTAEGSIQGAAILSQRQSAGAYPLPILFRNGIEFDVQNDNTSRAELRLYAGPEVLGGILEANGTPMESFVPYLLRPGTGILVRASDRGGLLKATFFWEEQQ